VQYSHLHGDQQRRAALLLNNLQVNKAAVDFAFLRLCFRLLRDSESDGDSNAQLQTDLILKKLQVNEAGLGYRYLSFFVPMSS
jgi:hypothetical protein